MTKDELRDALQGVPVERRLAVVFALQTDLRQLDVADKAGMTESNFSRTVAGRRDATPEERRAIAKAIGLPVAELFGPEALASRTA